MLETVSAYLRRHLDPLQQKSDGLGRCEDQELSYPVVCSVKHSIPVRKKKPLSLSTIHQRHGVYEPFERP
jgi:hypothetical protein